MKPIISFKSMIQYSQIIAEGRPFSFVVGDDSYNTLQYTVIHGAIIPAYHVEDKQYSILASCKAKLVSVIAL